MIFEKMRKLFTIFYLMIYKLIYYNRLYFRSFPKITGLKLYINNRSCLSIGNNLSGRSNVTIRILNDGKVEIGDNVFFNDFCSLNCMKNICIKDNCIFGPNVMIFDHNHDKNNFNDFEAKKVTIGSNCWIGANVIILNGVTIGENTIIGAGSIVTKNISSNVIAVGVPCREKNKIMGGENENANK